MIRVRSGVAADGEAWTAFVALQGIEGRGNAERIARLMEALIAEGQTLGMVEEMIR